MLIVENLGTFKTKEKIESYSYGTLIVDGGNYSNIQIKCFPTSKDLS